jgi:hypothetical protein
MQGMGGGGVGCGVSANEYSCAHGAQINFGDRTLYLTYICMVKAEEQQCRMRISMDYQTLFSEYKTQPNSHYSIRSTKPEIAVDNKYVAYRLTSTKPQLIKNRWHLTAHSIEKHSKHQNTSESSALSLYSDLAILYSI